MTENESGRSRPYPRDFCRGLKARNTLISYQQKNAEITEENIRTNILNIRQYTHLFIDEDMIEHFIRNPKEDFAKKAAEGGIIDKLKKI